MRIPDSRLHQSALRMIGAARTRMDDLQRQIATGKRLAFASDDPLATVGAQSVRAFLAANGVYQRNIADATSWSAANDQALQTVSEIVMRLQETAVRGGDAAVEDRKTLGDVVDQLLQELISQGNVKLGDRQLFGGFESRTAPYATTTHVSGEVFQIGPAGTMVDLANARLVAGSVVVRDISGSTTFVEGVDYRVDAASGRIEALAGGALVAGQDYRADYDTATASAVEQQSGDDGVILRRIGRDQLHPVNLRAAEVFGPNSELFQIAIDLKNALWKDDAAGARAVLDSVEAALERIRGHMGVTGARAETLQRQQAFLESDAIMLQDQLSMLEDADVAAVFTHLQSQQTAYEAALAVTARMFQIGLVKSL